VRTRVSGETLCDVPGHRLGQLRELRLMQQLEAVDQEVLVPAEVDGGPPALPAGARAGVEGGAEQAEDDGFAPHAQHDRILKAYTQGS
jgi:hypothetical protein